MFEVVHDLRFALRRLLKSPGFFAMGVISLALGIGANTAVFSMLNGLLFRPLPVRDADRLVVVSTRFANVPYNAHVSYPNYRDLLERSRSIEDAVAFEPAHPGMAADEFAAKISGAAVTSNFFEFFGLVPSLGRFFAPHDDEALGSTPEIVLGHAFWQTRLGGDPSFVGRTVRLNGDPFEVVGVAPEGFRGAEVLVDPEFYAPMSMAEKVGAGQREDRGASNHRVLARPRPGVTAGQAQAEFDLLTAGLIEEHPERLSGMSLHVIPELRARPDVSIHGIMPAIATIFLAMVGLVLLIACANIANLVLVRGLGRKREMALRAALGATRGRLAWPLLAESLIVGLAGGALGLVAASWAAAGLEGIRPPSEIPFVFDYSLDGRVLAFTSLATLGTTLLFGLLPSIRASRTDLAQGMNDGGRGASEGRSGRRARSALVVAEFALAAVLLITAGLFWRSLQEAENTYLGFEPGGTLIATVSPNAAGYESDEASRLLERVLERARELPGVSDAAMASTVPLGFSASGGRFHPEGVPLGPDERMHQALYSVVSDDYFETLRTPLLGGRALDARDDAEAPRVAVVNAAMAERFWPGQSAVGRRFIDAQDRVLEVVGVVPTGKYQILGEDDWSFVFLPWAQRPRTEMSFHLRTDGDPEALAATFRALVREVAPAVPVSEVFPYDRFVRDGKGLMPFRLGSILMSAFAALGLALAAIGIFGALSYFVSSRTNEIGVRMALGADRGTVVSMVLGSGVRLAAVGLALGLIAALATASFVDPLLIGVEARDPLTYGLVVVFLVAVTLAACALPVLRAVRLSPVEALRHE